MRVISGKYKGKRFAPPRKFSSRPTTDMAKEALFSILDARVYFDRLDILDLFSGTGNISVEFLSRGVGKVISVDNHAVSVRFQEQLKDQLKDENWHIIKQNALDYLAVCPYQFDIIFADPPYGFESTRAIPELVFEHNLLVEDGTLVVEHGPETTLSDLKGYKETRNYGGVHFSFFEA